MLLELSLDLLVVELFCVHDIPTVVTSCKDKDDIVPKVWKVLHDIVECLQNRYYHVHANLKEMQRVSKMRNSGLRLQDAPRPIESKLLDIDHELNTHPESILKTSKNAVTPRRVPTDLMYSFKMGIFFSSSPSVSASPTRRRNKKSPGIVRKKNG